jgi:hypothetical protein
MKQYPPRVNRPTDTKKAARYSICWWIVVLVLPPQLSTTPHTTRMWKAVAYSTWDSWCNRNHSIGCWRNQWIRTTDALFLVNCWFSNFMNFSSINVSDTKTWISTSYLWGATWDSWKSHLLLMRLAASTKFLTRLIGFSPWIMAPWTPHFRNHQLPCFWHETIPVRSADHEVVARYHGSRRHFVRLVLWARPMIFGGKGKAEFSCRAGYHSHVTIDIYIY